MGLLITIALIVIGVIWLVVTYNGLVRLKKRVENAWSQIEVQLRRRHDLIPNLVNSVKGYMKYEKETLERVMNARAKAVSGGSMEERMKAEGELSGLLSRLFAVMENYPDLKANENVSRLMEELTSTEDKISYSRQFYNDVVMKYNTKLEVFPSNIVARMFNFKPSLFFETPEETKEVPQVDLGT